MSKLIDITGKKYGKLLVKSRSGTDKNGLVTWNCVCDCGTVVVVIGNNLKMNHTTSCGCHQKNVMRSIRTKHGHSNGGMQTKTYKVWAAMKARCNNTNLPRSCDYVGRGIEVCERWLNFENFLADMGERPSGMSIDRINNNEGYSPDNCRWATSKDQGNNKRNNVLLTLNGKSQTITQWADETGIPEATIRARVHKLKWSDDAALLTPVRKVNATIRKHTTP